LLCKSFIPFSFLPLKPLLVPPYTNYCFWKSFKLMRETEIQPKIRRKGNMVHVLPKPHLNNKNSKIYLMSKFKPILKLSACTILFQLHVHNYSTYLSSSYFAFMSNFYSTYMFSNSGFNHTFLHLIHFNISHLVINREFFFFCLWMLLFNFKVYIMDLVYWNH
jgi:hypothetical protein